MTKKQKRTSKAARGRPNLKTQEKFRQIWAKIVIRAWSDDEFKHKLIHDPEAVLKEYHVDVPGNIDLKIIETTPKKEYLVLPPKPQEALSDLDMKQIVGGLHSLASLRISPER